MSSIRWLPASRAALRFAAITCAILAAMATMAFAGVTSADTGATTGTLYRANGTPVGKVSATTLNGVTTITVTLTGARASSSYYVTDCITDPRTNALDCPISTTGYASLFPSAIYPYPYFAPTPYVNTATAIYFTITTDQNGSATTTGTLPSFPAVSTVLLTNVVDPSDVIQTVLVMSGSYGGICLSGYC